MPEMTDAQKELHKKAVKRYKDLTEYWAENREAALEDMRFRAGDHWPDKLKELRTKTNRPLLVVDKLNQYVRQVVNDGRQNRPAIKIRPIDDKGDVEIAEALQGIVRHICDRSNADEAFDTALEAAVVGGFGFYRVLTEYAHESTFDQEICVERIQNPLAVLLGEHSKADGSDAKDGFIVDEIPRDEFKERYPGAKFSDWENDKDKYSEGWESGENVRICEYWYKEDKTTKLHLLADGTTATEEEYQTAITELGVEAVPPITKTRDVEVDAVKWCRLSGAEILEENDWLGCYIPIVPVYGNEYNLDGKVIYSGLIRAAKDPQRLYNYSRSAYAERVALTPKSPWVAAAGQVDDHAEWEDANVESYSVLKYDPVDVNGSPLPPPQRTGASDIPEGFARDMALSEHDIQASMGMYSASIGQAGNERSGKAIMARQREGDTATFHYQDNAARGIRYLGMILVDLIPKIYDSRRVIRILGEDGSSEQAEIDPNQSVPAMKMGNKTIYNIGIGKYDVNVAAGPSYTTRRVEQSEAMMELVHNAPEIMQIAGDLLIKGQDWPGADELAERFKLMLPPPIQQALAQDKQGIPPEAQAMMAQAEQAVQQRDQQIQEMGQAIQEAQQAVSKLELQVKDNADKVQVELLKVKVDEFKAQTDRMQAEAAMSQTPQDTTQFDALKLQYEDKWKQLDSDTKVLIAEMQAKTTLKTAAMSANADPNAETMVDNEGNAQASPALTALIEAVNQNMMALMQGNQAIAEGLHHVAHASKLPRIAIRDAQGNLLGSQVKEAE